LKRVVAGTVLIIALLATILFRAQVTRYALRFTGERIDVGGYSLRIKCSGSGAPAVVFDAGLTHGIDTWKRVLPKISKSTLTCAYDRAGIGGSDDPDQRRRTGLQIINELNTLLRNAQIPGPYVLVGHSFGGLNVRLYAGRYPDQVVGLVLVDPSHENQTARYAELMTAEKRAGFLAYEGGNNPEHVDVITSAAQVRAAAPIREMPFVVITAEHQSWLPNNKEIERVRQELQLELAHLVPGGVQVHAKGSDHFVQLDRPELVIQAIMRVLQQVRNQ
jgi:pimeloyl-ACP methyl ester carboxylesterase